MIMFRRMRQDDSVVVRRPTRGLARNGVSPGDFILPHGNCTLLVQEEAMRPGVYQIKLAVCISRTISCNSGLIQ